MSEKLTNQAYVALGSNSHDGGNTNNQNTKQEEIKVPNYNKKLASIFSEVHRKIVIRERQQAPERCWQMLLKVTVLCNTSLLTVLKPEKVRKTTNIRQNTYITPVQLAK